MCRFVMVWVAAASVASLVSGCYFLLEHQMKPENQPVTALITGTFLDQGDALAALDLSFARGSKPEKRVSVGRKYVWSVVLTDAGGRKYNTTVELFAKGVLSSRYYQQGDSCPVWYLKVNGEAVHKDTQGWGHWGWRNPLRVSGVTLAVYGPRGEVQAQVFVSE